MRLDFDIAEQMFKEDKITVLSQTQDGLRYLKIRSLSRKKYLKRLVEVAELDIDDYRVKVMFRGLYEKQVPIELIDKLIEEIYEEQRAKRRAFEDELVHSLYQLHVFDWGGIYRGGLERTIVNNYVKRIWRYETLCQKIDEELHDSLRGYVLCSWYNNWTSIIIEDVFRDHPNVLPAVGRVKSIDFFINDVPFDLKVTYLPIQYVGEKRREDGLHHEHTALKHLADDLGIFYDKSLSGSQFLRDLWQKLSDHPSAKAAQGLRELKDFRDALLGNALQDPSELIQWLYENQGRRRFDAANRLFLILINRSSYFDSWKLKRARPLLVERISSYLDTADQNPGNMIDFEYEGQNYEALSEAIIIVHD
jgi:hypothetical protein